jgi:hypothetical protein
MPEQARALKKYFSGIGPVSRTEDKEHTLASLGQAEVLSVQNTPGGRSFGSADHARARPPFLNFKGFISANKGSEEAPKSIVCGAENSGDVLPDCVSWSNSANCSDVFKRKVPPWIVQTLAKAGDRE